MEKVLIDTDAIIDFLRGYNLRIRDLFQKIQSKKIKAFLSVVNVVELYAGKDSANKKKKLILDNLLSYFEIIPLDGKLAAESGNLKREYDLILADSIIAASCLKIGASLITFNQKHFKKIQNLRLINV
ncbi:hypothetical protein A3D78_03000 [Candidatus Gottesmanbacteria bacterium RIFCSPHIGHO2_02_FULL_39_14]|uniref:PIN domain-containing protein n=2 Tax=Candidatus Gottesmaniibacteriota TaxID=1752720 RepID=A0A1F5ZTU8_9BACT|nr:MAG: hypothetical protein A3D78_03000 [Candidatus Gottesmanbacteria bacterium RIFCSPHIGHO2_02_FULL_39_14]OGG30876.1 MAG: hypothetical protein A3I51_03795 [Candidatus Gottesmanbacteria bacterium RIFCSPLOWO2_02_FULL_38_8]